MFKLQRDIYKLAASYGACERLEEVKKCVTEDELANLMYKHIDFCFKNNFPGREIMAANADLLARHGILSSGNVTVSHKLKKYILTGDARLSITISGGDIVFIYATDQARVNVTVKDRAIVSIQGWGNSFSRITAKDDATALAYLTGGAGHKEYKQGKSIIRAHKYERDYI